MNSWLIAVIAYLLFETEYSKGEISIPESSNNIMHYSILACSTEGDIRLANGRNKFEGRVEVCQGGQWKTVCERWWDNREADVVCRQLGFSGNLERRFIYFHVQTCFHANNATALGERDINIFGQGSGAIIEVEWSCYGSETNLLDCPRFPNACDHTRDAGVYCFGKTHL